jgi:hypothetical protein
MRYSVAIQKTKSLQINPKSITMATPRSEQIRDALSRPLPSTRVRRKYPDLYHAVLMFGVAENMIREQMPHYDQKLQLVVANSNKRSVAFMYEPPHPFYKTIKPPPAPEKDAWDTVARNLEALKVLDHVVVCSTGLVHLMLYRKKLLTFVESRMGWSLETIPSKVAKALSKTLSTGITKTVKSDMKNVTKTVKRDYSLAISCREFADLLVITRRDVCEGCNRVTAELKMCGNCRTASYCSVECQKAHWVDKHKAECRLLKESGPSKSTIVWDAATLHQFQDACAL